MAIQRNNVTQRQVAEISPPYVKQLRGTVGVIYETISFGITTRDILIVNTHATQKLYVLFKKNLTEWNEEINELSINKNYGSVVIMTRHQEIKIRGEAGGSTYTIAATQE